MMKQFARAILPLCFTAFAHAACPSAHDKYVVFSVPPQPGASSDFSYLVTPRLVPFMDDSNGVMLLNQGVQSIVVGKRSDYFSQFASTLVPAVQRPANQSPAPFISMQVPGSQPGCFDILETSPGRTFVILFSATNQNPTIQDLSPSQLGFDLSSLSLSMSDVDGDGRSEIVASEGSVARAALIVAADGTLSVDPKSSITQVWRSFVAACARVDRSAAVRHLSPDGSNNFSAMLLATGNDISQLARNISDYEAHVENNVAWIRVLYLNPDSTESGYSIYFQQISGLWYISIL